MKNNNNKYDDEFKASAVKMVVEKGFTISEVVKDLELSELTLRRWVRAVTKLEDLTSKRLAELEAENKKLKKELEDAKDTVNILKKLVSIFIKP